MKFITYFTFLGVSEESKTYRLYNFVTRKIMVSKDMIFGEGIRWSWENKKENGAPKCEFDEVISEDTTE